MFQDRLAVELLKVAERYERLWRWRLYASLLLVAAFAEFLAQSLGQSLFRDWVSPNIALVSVALCGAFCTSLLGRYLVADPLWVARKIEEHYPELNSCLLAAVEQQPDFPNGKLGYLQESVVRQALAHAGDHDWWRIIPTRRMAAAATTSLLMFALLGGLLFTNVTRVKAQLAKKTKTGQKSAATASEFAVTVEPGDAEIEKGSSLLVLARVKGPLPAESTLVYQPSEGDATRLAMNASLDDPIFGGRVSVVTQPLTYHVELGGFISPTYKVSVFEYPRLERADAKLEYPSYTGLENRVIQDIRTISVVEGTAVTLICQLNKKVKSATLIEASDKKGSPVAPLQEGQAGPEAHQPANLTLTERDGTNYEARFIAQTTRRFKLDLIDDSGRHNTEQAMIVVQVVPNLPPNLKLVAPGRDLEVSPLEELDVKATAWDDYGVKRMGVSFALAGQEPADIVLGENAAAKTKHEIARLIRLEDLQAEPDQLLAYHFWAEDFGSDGKLRRTSSDMYFAEVRHFEEIFRQGQQEPGGQQQQRPQQQQGQGQNAQQAQQLAQLQKDIINATWKLIRRETAAQPTAPFTEDVKQIAESQTSALEQADALGERIRDVESQGHLLAVLEAMQQAVRSLKEAQDQPAVKPLQPALAAEQRAYQALLKLRAREHEVVRQQQQQSSSSSSQSARSPQQRQQMQQLDLTNEENRYETQRLAQAQQEQPEDRETRQVLNRLKELARRQHDLNERLKDLQTALQEANTEQKREEIKQQLKRLQDEQREVLRDTEELQTRMETPENQERMAEERQQLEQARDQVQRSSESLDKEQVTQATAAGTRAEREFEDLRNEFRRRSSSRFNDQLKEMRETARELDQQEKKLAEKLEEVAAPGTTKPTDANRKSLSTEDPTEQIAQGLSQQKEKLTNLTERLKETVQEAELTEPLLSEKLHDAARNVQDQNVERALDTAGRTLRQGFVQDARDVEKLAGRGIQQLKEGIEKAAESVLGDEAEALRRAREQLRDLSKELNEEIARNAPGEQPAQSPNQDANADGQPQQPGDPYNQPGQTGRQQDPNAQSQPGASGRQPGPTGERPERTGNERPQGQGGNAEQSEQEQQQQEREADSVRPPGQPGQQPGQRQQQPGQRQPGQQPGQGGQPGQPMSESEGQPQEGQSPMDGQPMPGQGRQPGQGGQQSGQNPRRGQGQQTGQDQQAGQDQPGQRGARNAQRGPPRSLQNRPQAGQRTGGTNALGGNVMEGEERELAPISGEDFMRWSDRLRDVEEMVDDPELRAEAARIRDQARSIRAELKRHSAEPNWKLVRVNVAEPLMELANRVNEELLRRNSKQALVPLDRDPVPPKYSEKTRKYYERLGSGQ